MPHFTCDPICKGDKDIFIHGPDSFVITVDYDDVYHAQVRKDVIQLLNILNKYWNQGAIE